MPLESGTYISDLNATNPVGATDPKSQGDDHIRLIKNVLKSTFPSLSAAVMLTANQLNYLAGANGNTGTGNVVFSNSPAFTGNVIVTGTLSSANLSPNGGANSNALVGLTRIDGTANTFARSDSAPALNVAIVPTWTGVHTFSAKPVLSAGFTSSGVSTVTAASGAALTVTGAAGAIASTVVSGLASNASGADIQVNRAGSTVNQLQQGPTISLFDNTNTTASSLQQSGGQTELWQFNGSWIQQWRITTSSIFQARDQAGSMQDVGWRDAPLNAFNANYTTVMGDRGKAMEAIAGMTFTIASNASVAYPVGAVLTFINASGGNISIAIASDSLTLAGTATTGTRTLVNAGIATAIKIGATSWLIAGTGLS